MSSAPVETHDIEMDEPTYPDFVTLSARNPDGSFVDMKVPGELICKASELVEETVDAGCRDDDDETIPLPDMTVDQLQFILNFYTRYFAEPFDIPENNEEDQEKWFVLKEGNLVANGFPEWAEKMLDDIPLTPEPIKDHGRFKGLFDLFKAAQFMICNKLVTFISLKLSSMITGKTSEKIRELFAIENDFDDVDEFEWVEEEIPIKDPVTGEVTRTVTRKYKRWIQITKATAKVANSVPV